MQEIFKEGIISFGILHVVKDPENLLQEFYRILKVGGDLHISCLCTDRKISEIYLKILYKNKLVASCLKSKEIKNVIEKIGFKTDMRVIGGMTYIDAKKL
ncbi:MAG: methyltransferase domain-containing protein [Leptospirales bacterium]